MFEEMFEPEWGEDNSPIDRETNIRQKLLYFSDNEHKEFNQLCKVGMKIEYPENFQESNQSDFLLKILRKLYGNNQGQETAN